MAARLDPLARAAFLIALRDGRCGEMVACLFDGGAFTVDPSGVLILIPHESIAELSDGS